jgi:putative PLP-dependent aminotransferase (TIGR04422 family)
MQQTPAICLDTWPKPVAPAVRIQRTSAEALEAALAAMFPGAHPVAFSSGRAGLSAIVASIGLGRLDCVSVPGYSSHCVLEAVSRFATPIPYSAATDAKEGRLAQLIYHPFGYVSPFPLSAKPDEVIDDAVDTYLAPGQAPLVSRRRFLVWSCSKVLGTYAGGVVFCREAQDSDRLRDVRQKRAHMVNAQHDLRIAAFGHSVVYLQWSGAESLAGEPHSQLATVIAEALRRYGEIYRLVQARFDALLEHDYFWQLQPIANAVPSNVVVDPAQPIAEYLGRTFALTQRQLPIRVADGIVWKPVKLLPLHIGISESVFSKMLRQVTAFRDFSGNLEGSGPLPTRAST